jgi:regulator of protease activity HflC (stomatin/prohibitin superfamily)
MDKDERSNFFWTGFAYLVVAPIVFLLALSILIGVIWGLFALGKPYKVWALEKDGQAELAQAQWSKQIAVVEAEATRDGATMLAAAEVERAKGVAEANKIIGDSLKDNEEYLRWLWVEHISTTDNQVLYIPTEAGLPILEAGKR